MLGRWASRARAKPNIEPAPRSHPATHVEGALTRALKTGLSPQGTFFWVGSRYLSSRSIQSTALCLPYHVRRGSGPMVNRGHGPWPSHNSRVPALTQEKKGGKLDVILDARIYPVGDFNPPCSNQSRRLRCSFEVHWSTRPQSSMNSKSFHHTVAMWPKVPRIQ